MSGSIVIWEYIRQAPAAGVGVFVYIQKDKSFAQSVKNKAIY